MTYPCIDQLQQKANGVGVVTSLCRLLGVSRSGYYARRGSVRLNRPGPTRSRFLCKRRLPHAVEAAVEAMAAGA